MECSVQAGHLELMAAVVKFREGRGERAGYLPDPVRDLGAAKANNGVAKTRACQPSSLMPGMRIREEPGDHIQASALEAFGNRARWSLFLAQFCIEHPFPPGRGLGKTSAFSELFPCLSEGQVPSTARGQAGMAVRLAGVS